jgi:hypothetical protein
LEKLQVSLLPLGSNDGGDKMGLFENDTVPAKLVTMDQLTDLRIYDAPFPFIKHDFRLVAATTTRTTTTETTPTSPKTTIWPHLTCFAVSSLQQQQQRFQSDDHLTQVIQSHRELKDLRLVGVGVDDMLLETICEFLGSTITYLDISLSPHVSDKGIHLLAWNCVELIRIKVRGCPIDPEKCPWPIEDDDNDNGYNKDDDDDDKDDLDTWDNWMD